MILARVKNTTPNPSKDKKRGTPELEEFVSTRDFQGAISLLEVS